MKNFYSCAALSAMLGVTAPALAAETGCASSVDTSWGNASTAGMYETTNGNLTTPLQTRGNYYSNVECAATQMATTDCTGKVLTTKEAWSGGGTYGAFAQKDGTIVPLVEQYYDKKDADTIPLKQTVSGLQKGYYVATMYAYAQAANGATSGTAVTSDDTFAAYIYATVDNATEKTAIYARPGSQLYYDNKYCVPFEITEDNQSVELGVAVVRPTDVNWILTQIYSLEKYDSEESAQQAVIESCTASLKEAVEEAEYNLANSVGATAEGKTAYQSVVKAARTDLDVMLSSYLYASIPAGMAKAVTHKAALRSATAAYFKAGARPTNGAKFDITGIITNQGFDTNEKTGWTGAGTVNYNEVEYYQTSYDLNQTLTSLPAGLYTLKCAGFQRKGFSDTVVPAYLGAADKANGTYGTEALLYAGSEETAIKSIAYAASTTLSPRQQVWNYSQVTYNSSTYYVPNNMATAELAMDCGQYDNELTFQHAADGDLKFGVKLANSVSGDWSIFDDFRLYVTSTETTLNEESEEYTKTNGVTDVKILRNFVEGWNSLCLPFATDQAALKAMGAESVKKFTGVTSATDGLTLQFADLSDGEAVEAGTPLMVKFASSTKFDENSATTFAGVTLVDSPTPVSFTADNAKVTFTGTFVKTAEAFKANPFTLIHGKGLYNYEAGATATALATRAVFVVTPVDETTATASIAHTNLDVMPTGINGVAATEDASIDANGTIYDLQGRRVSNPVTGGVYIQGGKKIVVK